MNTIVCTGCNSGMYFKCAEMLISSIYKNCYDLVDSIRVLDLGLTNDEIILLNSYDKVVVDYIPIGIKKKHYNFYWDLKNFGWKVYYINALSDMYKNCNIIWADAGICFINSIKEILDIMEDEKFFITDLGLPTNIHIGNTCIKYMNVTDHELECNQVQAGLIGILSDKYKYMIRELYNYSRIWECLVTYDKYHTKDQSILSILCNRCDIDMKCSEHFLYWYGGSNANSPHYHVDPVYGTSYPQNCISICHRGSYLSEYNKLIKYIRHKKGQY